MIFLLLLLNLMTLKPGFYLAGWDNFSSSLDLSLNLPRTLFATWREYRGLGVPSDSEGSDLFRQIFFIPARLFLGTPLAEQSYLLFCLNVGVVAMFLLAKEVLREVASRKQLSQLAGFVAGFFYLFNLNTLIIFFLPMDMYISRFALFPLTIFFWLKMGREQKVERKTLFLFLVFNLFLSAAYLTATVFITLSFILGLVILFQKKLWLKNFLILASFILINSFWLLPFANYAVQKSAIIPQASTFINPNEIQLNEDPRHFAWEKILTLYPTDFYTRTETVTGSERLPLHPLVDGLTVSPLLRGIVFIFPLLYLFGLGLFWPVFKKAGRKPVWLLVLFLAGLVLLRKEYPPFGFAYDWLGEKIPLFKIIFRFGSEKFAPFLLIPACILAAVSVTAVAKFISRRGRRFGLIPALLLIIYLFPFRFYLKGGVVSPLMFNRIPSAYFKIAETINQDPNFGRVLHLPEAESSYWKSYSWGYNGSSFLAFLLKKSLIEKTFIPASLENDRWLQAVRDLSRNSQAVARAGEIAKVSQLFLNLCREAQVGYLIWDQTVMTAVAARDRIFWDRYQKPEIQEIVSFLQEEDYLQEISRYQVDQDFYSELFFKKGFTEKNLKSGSGGKDEIILYRLNDSFSPVESVRTATLFDSRFTNLFSAAFLERKGEYLLQEEGQGYKTLPFYQLEAEFSDGGDYLQMGLPTHSRTGGERYSVFVPESSGGPVSVELFGQLDSRGLTVTGNRLDAPKTTDYGFSEPAFSFLIPVWSLSSIDEQSLKKNYLADWHVLPQKSYSQLRLMINGLVLPLTNFDFGQRKPLGTVLIDPGLVEIKILAPKKEIVLAPEEFFLTVNPNCFQDQIPGYQFSLETEENLTLTSQNGTTCLVKSLEGQMDSWAEHLELEISYQFRQEDIIDPYPAFQTSSHWQKAVRHEVDQLKPLAYFTLCLMDPDTGECLNNHTAVLASNHDWLTVPALKKVTRSGVQILLTLPTINYQKNTLTIEEAVLKEFYPVFSTKVEIKPEPSLAMVLNAPMGETLPFTIPKMISAYAYFFQPGVDAFVVYNRPCAGSDSYRSVSLLDQKTFFYNENCQNGATVTLPFASENFYFWQVGYHLFSGKYPRMVLRDDFYDYLNQYLSLNQGYPYVVGFKNLQRADPFCLPWQDCSFSFPVRKELSLFVLQTSFNYLYPRPDFEDFKDKVFTIEQDGKNQGLFALSGFNLMVLPSHWREMELQFGQAEKQYCPLQIVGSSKILPSLWRSMVFPEGEDDHEEYLLVFNQAFDRQWQIYRGSALNALLGIGRVSAKQVKVNGWANGWEIDKDELNPQEPAELFFFYSPERLAIAGWGLTILSLLIIPKILPLIWSKLKN